MRTILFSALLTISTVALSQTSSISLNQETFCQELSEIIDYSENYFDDIIGDLISTDTSGSTSIDYYASDWSFTDLPEGYVEDYLSELTFMLDIGYSSESNKLSQPYEYLLTMIKQCLGSEWTVHDESPSESLAKGVYFQREKDENLGPEVGLAIFKDGDEYWLQLAIYPPL